MKKKNYFSVIIYFINAFLLMTSDRADNCKKKKTLTHFRILKKYIKVPIHYKNYAHYKKIKNCKEP